MEEGVAQGPGWSVVAMAKEDPAVIRRFVAWHLSEGAAAITLFFDDPEDPCIAMLTHLERVRAVACTPEFWASLGLTPQTRFTKRQNAACRLGYDAAPPGWVLNIDADELLWVGTPGGVGGLLGRMPGDCRSVLIEPAERVLLNGDETGAVFRTKMGRRLVRRVYGDDAGLVIRNDGLVGHNIGKSILRTGLGQFWLRQHFGQLKDGSQIVDATIPAGSDAALLHYFSRGYDDWRRKLDYRLANRGFRHRMRAAFQAARDAGDEAALQAYYKRLHEIDSRQAEILDRAGCLVRPRLDLDARIARYFPN